MERWKKRVRRTCVSVIILAVVLRLGGSGLPAMTEENKYQVASFLLYLQTGYSTIPYQPAEIQPSNPLPAETEPPVYVFPTFQEPQEVLTFSSQDAQGLGIKYGGSCRPDLGTLLEQPVELDFSGDAPRILIIHTHATESYTPEPGWEYTAAGNYRTLDEDHNMLRVGQAMADILNEAGIPTIHDRTLHDYPSYNSSYDRALETIQYYLEEYPSIQMVIDVHRDAIEDSGGNQIATAAVVNGKPSAQVMLVMGTDEGGLTHPNWQDNLSWALKLQTQMDRIYPGLARSLSLRTQRFNQHATPGSILVEIGTAGDTLQSALTAAEAFTRMLVEIIKGLELA